MATNYSASTDATNKIEEIFGKNQAANTTAAAQTSALNNATEQAYKERQLQGQQAQNQFAQNTTANQVSAIDAIRRSNASAIANGANAGLSAANQLSAILGLQEDTTAEATQLANDAISAASERNTAMAQNAVTGQQQANQINQANLDRDLGLASLFPQMSAAQAEKNKATATEKAAEYGAWATTEQGRMQQETAQKQLDASVADMLYNIRTDMKNKEGYSDAQVAAMENAMLKMLQGLGLNVSAESGLGQGQPDKAAMEESKKAATEKPKTATEEAEAALLGRLELIKGQPGKKLEEQAILNMLYTLKLPGKKAEKEALLALLRRQGLIEGQPDK